MSGVIDAKGCHPSGGGGGMLKNKRECPPPVTPPVFFYMSDRPSEPLGLLLFGQDEVHLLLALSGNVPLIVF